jgi:protein O-GlcNAc transferase
VDGVSKVSHFVFNENLDSARTACEALLAAQPCNPVLLHLLGLISHAEGRISNAINYIQRAVEIRPAEPGFLNNLGVCYLLNDPRESLRWFLRALEADPTDQEIQSNVGLAYGCTAASLAEKGCLSAAVRAYRQAIRYRPDLSEAHNNLAGVLLQLGRGREAICSARRAVQVQPFLHATQSNYLYNLNFDPNYNPNHVFEEHARWGRSLEVRALNHRNERSPDRPLRIGYVWGDHPDALFLLPTMANHSRHNFQVYCYSNMPRSNPFSDQLRQAADRWFEITELDDIDASEQIRQDEIDILVDRTGHIGGNRLMIFAQKPAPVQTSIPGYPSSTGLWTIDYRITDSICDPEGTTEAFHSEELVRLPDVFTCYQPPESPPVASLPALRKKTVTFGSFNARAKISSSVVSAWATIMHRVPDSRILFHHVFGGQAEVAREIQRSLIRRFHKLGISPLRIEFVGARNLQAHLEIFNQVDLALDSFPFSGMTTTCESLWMGVPVITIIGRSHLSRVSSSFLTAVGLREFIAESTEGYIDLAVRFASALDQLAVVRQHLRTKVQSSALTDAAKYTSFLEGAYRSMWQRWCKS